MFFTNIEHKIFNRPKLSAESKIEFNNNRVFTNFKRGVILSVILLLMNIVLLFIDIFYYQKWWAEMEGYRNLYNLHIYFLFIQAIYFILIYFKKIIKSKTKKFLIMKSINYYLYISVISWCILLSLNSQLIHNQISSYIICIFCIAAIMKLTPWESGILFIISFIIFFLGLSLINESVIEVSGSLINLLFVLVLSLTVSNMHYFSAMEHFRKKKIIIKKNKELKKHDKLKTVFLGNVSHELKTPLNLIYSAEQLLRYHCDQVIEPSKENKAKAKKYVNIIKQNCYRLMRLIDNLLDITKMDTGEYKINLGNNDIVKIITNIVDSVTTYVESNNLELSYQTDLKKKIIACDPDAVERIVLNLISNAIKHTPGGGKIKINIYDKKDMIYFSVSDNGKGIPPEQHEDIFTRFKQAGNFFTRDKEGSGIGLSLVKYLVEMHDGKVYLESQPGEGSTFIVEFQDRLVIDQDRGDRVVELNNEDILEKIEVEFADIYS